MKNLKVKVQKSTDPFWTDETGAKVQYNRLHKHEKLAEKYTAKALKDALHINALLLKFKDMVREQCEQLMNQYLEDKNLESYGTKGKGNVTWFNFDRSIKMEVAIHEQIAFDDKGVQVCKDLLDQFINDNVESKQGWVKEMINDAFATSRGKLDTKKVMSLFRYRSKIKDELFHQALNELEQSIRRPSSKSYFRIWVMDQSGEYQNVDLNFSSVKD